MTKRIRHGVLTLFAVLLMACAARPARTPLPPVTPTPSSPPRAVENPPDVRARLPLRPTPPQPESKFPPPQQSEEEERRTANPPAEPELLHVEPAVLLDGQPFPEKKPYDPKFPEPRRTRYVSADASGPGDGTLEHPWKDLQEALCLLVPGDRLVVGAAVYEGSFSVAGPCHDGTADAPIQVFARHAFLKPRPGGGDVLRLERSHWQLWELQIALLESESAGLVTTGPDAHDIAVDQSHIYEGKGAAVRFQAGSARITLSNCHIHQSMGVRVERGSSEITLVNNHIHHNRAASVRIGGGPLGPPARDVLVLGNRIHNDRGPALEISDSSNIRVLQNKLSNYRPEEGRPGEALVIGPAAEGVRVLENTILEASTAIRVGDPARADRVPSDILVARNYMENRLTSESLAMRVDGGRKICFCNNIVDHYAEGFRLAAVGVREISIANNLFLAPSLAFTLLSQDSMALFDFNVFGAAGPIEAVVDGGRVDLGSWMRSRMPHSRLLPADVSGRDLAKVVGFSPVDAGTPVAGLPYRGAAPDIGVAER